MTSKFTPSRRQFFASLVASICLVLCCLTVNTTQAQQQSLNLPQEDPSSETCSTDDLNHSVLVECSVHSCVSEEAAKWPTSLNEIIHIQSSRAGERFVQTKLENLNLIEDHTTKLFNINTTLNVILPNIIPAQARPLSGFGATLNAKDLAAALEQDLFERLYCLVLDDLFGLTSSSAQLNLLRLTVGSDFYNGGRHNLSEVLLALDRQPKRHSATSRVKIELVVEFEDELKLRTELEPLSALWPTLSNVELWAIALKSDTPADASETKELVRKALPLTLLFTSASSLVGGNLLLRAQQSVPYETLDDIVARSKPGKVLTLSEPQVKTRDYGDWDNANKLAVQVLNNLRHGSLGYIEDQSVTDVMGSSSAQPEQSHDASVYSLHQSHGMHFRGPRFYALGHFSRYLKPGANRLKMELFTQPNMFAAHYGAFLSADRNYVVGIVINHNEHLLPFRMAINDVVMAFTGVQPKSFNTFLIKVKE